MKLLDEFAHSMAGVVRRPLLMAGVAVAGWLIPQQAAAQNSLSNQKRRDYFFYAGYACNAANTIYQRGSSLSLGAQVPLKTVENAPFSLKMGAEYTCFPDDPNRDGLVYHIQRPNQHVTDGYSATWSRARLMLVAGTLEKNWWHLNVSTGLESYPASGGSFVKTANIITGIEASADVLAKKHQMNVNFFGRYETTYYAPDMLKYYLPSADVAHTATLGVRLKYGLH